MGEKNEVNVLYNFCANNVSKVKEVIVYLEQELREQEEIKEIHVSPHQKQRFTIFVVHETPIPTVMFRHFRNNTNDNILDTSESGDGAMTIKVVGEFDEQDKEEYQGQIFESKEEFLEYLEDEYDDKGIIVYQNKWKAGEV